MPGLFGNLPPPAAPKPSDEADDAPEERRQKRQKRDEPADALVEPTHAPAAVAPPEEVPEAPKAEAPPPPAVPPTDQVAAALRRIRSHISNPKKFPKASDLLRQLLSGQGGAVLDPRRHGPAVFSALAASMTAPSTSNDPLLAREYSKLFTAASKRPELFSSAQKVQLDVYGIHAVLQNQMLTTDDSFAFSRTINTIKAALDELPPLEAPEQEEEEAAALAAAAAAQNDPDDEIEAWDDVTASAQRREALVACIAAGKGCYGRAWARTAVDLLVEAASAKTTPQDQRFLANQRQIIADMVQFVRDQKAARKTGPSGKEAARDQTQFERARAEWSRSATVGSRGKVGAGGDHRSEAWLG